MSPRIVAISGPLKRSVFPITESEFTLGRDAANQACLEDDLVSRRHCSIRLQDGVVLLSDLESRNGTFVNGARVSKKVLEHGDRLKIGSSRFVYHECEEAEDGAPAFTDADNYRLRTFISG